jgi:hypothetical protein
MQRDVKFDGSNQPIGWAVVLKSDRPWFFGTHAAVDLERLRGNGKQ